jgi:ATP-binding cassette subfamily C protein LapB
MDTFLQANLWICNHLGLKVTEASFRMGLPMQERLAPVHARRALEALGIKVKQYEGDLRDVYSLLFPVVARTKNNDHIVVMERVTTNGTDQYRITTFEGREPEERLISRDDLLTTLDKTYYVFKKNPFFKPDLRSDTVNKEDLVRLFWNYKQYYGNAILASFILNFLMTFTGLFVMTVYDRVIPYQAYSTLWVLAIAVITATLLSGIGGFIQSRLIEVASKKMDFVLGNDVFAKALYMRLESKPESTGFFVGQMGMYQQFREFFSGITLSLLIDLPFSLIFAVLTFIVAGPLGAVPLIAILIMLIVLGIIQIPLNRAIKELNNTGFSQAGAMYESIAGLETLRSTGTEGFMQNRFEGIHARISSLQLKIGMYSGVAATVTNLVMGLQSIIIIIWGVYLIGTKDVTLGGLFAAVMFSGRAMGPWSQVPAIMSQLSFIQLAVKLTLNILNLPSVRTRSANYLTTAVKKGSITLKEVDFSYPSIAGQTASGALANINLEIRAGEKVAFIGRMGSGKSTLLRVVGGLYQASGGQLLFDNIDSRQIDPSEIRTKIGFVGQEVLLFSGTLRSNILMGRLNISEEQFLTACRLTGADELALRHPLGFDQPIAEGGRGLSGGQRQIVSLTRTLITEPHILLMDEPTSSMDLQSEKNFVKQLEPIVKPKTLIVVTHRPQILAIVDRIVVLEKGKLYADGPKQKILDMLNAKKPASDSDSAESGLTISDLDEKH